MDKPTAEEMVDWIPTPEAVRAELAAVIRRIELLRHLLKVSERRERQLKKDRECRR